MGRKKNNCQHFLSKLLWHLLVVDAKYQTYSFGLHSDTEQVCSLKLPRCRFCKTGEHVDCTCTKLFYQTVVITGMVGVRQSRFIKCNLADMEKFNSHTKLTQTRLFTTSTHTPNVPWTFSNLNKKVYLSDKMSIFFL